MLLMALVLDWVLLDFIRFGCGILGIFLSVALYVSIII